MQLQQQMQRNSQQLKYVMTSRKPHMMDGPDNQDNVNVRTGPCPSSGTVICFDGGECEERSTSIGCQSQCYFPVNEAAIQKCNADNNVVEGFRENFAIMGAVYPGRLASCGKIVGAT
jgi:hypothetical protein